MKGGISINNKRITHNERLLILLFLSILFLSGSIFGIWIDPFIKKVDTQGVQSIEVQMYRYENDEWQVVDIVKADYTENGNVLSEIRTDGDGSLQFSYRYEYDNQGNMVQISGKRLSKGELIPYIYHYQYDERGNQIEGIRYATDSSVLSRYKAEYDENDHFVKGMNFVEKRADTRYLAEYNENGELIKESKSQCYEYKGETKYQLEYKKVYEYDESGNVIQELSYDDYEALEYKHQYQYDDSNNLIKAVKYEGDSQTPSQVYKAEFVAQNNLKEFYIYDPEGRIKSHNKAVYNGTDMIMEYRVSGDSTKTIYRASYDNQGNVVEEINYADEIGGDTITSKYVYSYDDRGNVITEKYYVYSEPENKWIPLSKQENDIQYFND